MDLASLVARDHEQLDRAISRLMEPHVTIADRRSALEAARIGLATHADGEAKVLHAALSHVAAPQDFAGVVAQVLAAHRSQESILRRMDHNADRADWACAAVRLRRSIVMHAQHEQAVVMTALRACLPVLEYHRLASAYASEKMRALGLMDVLSMGRRGRRNTAGV